MSTVYSLVCWGGKDGKTITAANLSTADPCVVTSTNHGVRDGMAVVFSTGGTLPTYAVYGSGSYSAMAGVVFYVKSTAANTFNLYDTQAHAIAGGTAGRIKTTGTNSGTHYCKSKKMLDYLASPPTTDRWGTVGSERCYDGFASWEAARVASYNAADEEVCELGEAFSDYIAYTGNYGNYQTKCTIRAAKTTITSKINGVRSSAFHGGYAGSGYVLVNNSSGAGLFIASGYNTEINGFSITSGQYVLAYQPLGFLCRNMLLSGSTNNGVSAIKNGSTFVNTAVYSCGAYGFYFDAYQSFINVLNCLATKNTSGGFKAYPGQESTVALYCYNSISVGNTANNWGTAPTLDGASNNAGLSGEAWGTGKVTIATTDFVNFAGNDFRPATSSSPQVDAGVEYYAIAAYDIGDNVRPNYNNGGAAAHDVGPYEFDHGYGPWPETLLTITNLIAGSTVRVFTAGTQTVIASTTSSSTSYTPSGLTAGSVDVTILKDGLIPLRFAGIALTSGTTVPIDGSQTLDRAFVASSGLTYGSTATINVGTSRFALTTATTGQNWYSFWIEQFRSNSDLYNVEFPLQANGPNSFTLRKGWEFSSGLTYITRDGIRYTDSSGTRTAAWAALLSVGVPAGKQVRFEQTDGAALSNAANTGNIDQLIQIYGDASHGNIDYTGYLVCKVQAQGYDQAEVDVFAQYGTLEDQLYVIALSPAANGVAAANPTVSSVTITDHGASPVTWNSKSFSITITDSGTTSGETIMQWIRRAQEVGGTFQSKNAFNWSDLVQTNGDKFKGVRGALYGDTGATLKGVRVLRGTDAHPDFTMHTADDGTTVSTTPPAQATATVLANSRIQLYNVTTDAELDNALVTGTTYANTLVSGVSVGDTLRMRVCKLGYDEAESFSVWTANGCSFIVSQGVSDVYTSWGIDGSTVTEYTLDVTGLIEIDANDVDGVSTKARVGAFYNYALTTANGIRYAFGAMTFLSAAAIRINVDVCDLKLENVNSTTALRFTDLSVRLFRSDGSSIISDTSYSIHNDYSGVPDVVETGVSGLTGAESTQLMGLPSSTGNAAAVIAAMNLTPPAVNIQQVLGQSLKGDGSEANPWNPA